MQAVLEETPAPVEAAQIEFVPVDEAESDYISAPAPVQAADVADNVWHITYVPAWDVSAAPADGLIRIWANGRFIAHSGMANGGKTAALLQCIEVDGPLYPMTLNQHSGIPARDKEAGTAFHLWLE